jgi:putative transcriptional regulator
MGEFFEKTRASLLQAIAIAKGEMQAPRIFVPPELDVKAIRQRAKLTQSAFAEEFGFTVKQIKDWEQGRSRPLGGVRAYLRLIGKDPEAVRSLSARSD